MKGFDVLSMGVPTAEAKIETPNASSQVIDNDYFLMMTPDKDVLARTEMRRVALERPFHELLRLRQSEICAYHDKYIWM